MAQKIQSVKGMNDLLPVEQKDFKLTAAFWQAFEDTISRWTRAYGYQQIRTPIVEQTGLFVRSIGEETDVVGKEMYTFSDSNDSLSLSLRPEGTASCLRAVVEHNLLYNSPQKLWYMGPMFRRERPQKGRYRQFHQVGVEIFGIPNPEIDAELIALTARLWKDLGIFDHVTLQLNSIGSLEARKNYRQALVDFLQNHIDILDEDSKRRLTTNPLRILDSKDQRVQEVLNDAPKLHDYLDDDSREHFAQLCALLDNLGIQYEINQKLVRGLDYYNKTVFEWVTSALGAQGTVCGGGRYDGLVEQLGGHATSGVGFAMGLERLVLLVQEVNTQITLPSAVDIYIVYQGEGTTVAAFNLAEKLRSELPHLRTLLHCSGGNFKKQFKRADKSGAKLALVIGEDEVKNQQVVVKNLLQHSEQAVVALSDIINHIQNTFK